MGKNVSETTFVINKAAIKKCKTTPGNPELWRVKMFSNSAAIRKDGTTLDLSGYTLFTSHVEDTVEGVVVHSENGDGVFKLQLSSTEDNGKTFKVKNTTWKRAAAIQKCVDAAEEAFQRYRDAELDDEF